MSRIERAVERLRRKGTALWVHPSANFTYLFGLRMLSLERLCGVVVTASGDLRALVPLMHAEEFDELPASVERFVWSDGEGPESATAACLKGIENILVAPDLPAWALFNLRAASGAEIELDETILPGLRARKDPPEVADLLRAARITDEVVEWISGQIPLRPSEAELAARIKSRYLNLGHDEMVVLVASGANAAMPHHLGGRHPIDDDRPLLVDIGALIEMYWSDTTRVFFPDRNAEERNAYEAVLAAYDAAFEVVSPGVPCGDVDRAARSVLERAGYGDYFIHRTGHGLGLEVHEPPFIRAGNSAPLEIGNVFTIEPGVYLPGRFGLRYENTIHLGEDGPQALNGTPRWHSLM